MPRDPRTYLWDARNASRRIERCVRDATFADYQELARVMDKLLAGEPG